MRGVTILCPFKLTTETEMGSGLRQHVDRDRVFNQTAYPSLDKVRQGNFGSGVDQERLHGGAGGNIGT